MRNHQIAIELLRKRAAGLFNAPAPSGLGYELLDANSEQDGECSITGRQRRSEVVLVPALRRALQRLNKDVDPKLLEEAIVELTRDRSLLGMGGANEQIYQMLKDGVKLDTGKGRQRSERDEAEQKKIQVIDWEEPENNAFLLVANLWVYGQMGMQKVGLVGFVNGLPVLLPELSIVGDLQEIYDGAIAEYKRNLAQLFWYNAFIIVSDGRKSKMGSMSASWEFFFEWKRIADEKEQEDEKSRALDTILQGTCEKGRLLDIVENFTLFSQEGSGVKIIARNHQYLGVNAAFERIRRKEEYQGKLGVFWHTQGSGKSYSMAFFAQKVQRKLAGEWTFVIVTDREELDKQIYSTFASVGAVTEPEEAVHATGQGEMNGGQHLRQLLQHEKHRTVFTLIQKFYTEEPGQVYEELSQRSDIIIMADEAHRTQYDVLARHMREAFPNASFLGFTGTPLIVDEEQETLETFGSYISIYNFTQAVKDHVTVPLYYENHTMGMKLTNTEFAEAMQRLAEAAKLDEEQEEKLSERALIQASILTDDGRLEMIAQDIVAHFMGRGYRGKALVVSIDRLTAGRMYVKVQKYWHAYQSELEERLKGVAEAGERAELDRTITYMQQTEMTIVVSGGGGDVERFAAIGVDIQAHQRRMHKAAEHFKADDNPLRIVFVCAMWMTGFDVKCLSTMYLDRPLRGHTLMQTIARVNRVHDKEKMNGLIVDYVGNFNNLRDALAIYATEDDERTKDLPVGDKSELVRVLQEALQESEEFCRQEGLDMQALLAMQSSRQGREQKVQSIQGAANRLVVNDEVKLRYLTLAGDVRRLYKAILPDPTGKSYEAQVYLVRQIELTIYAAMRCSSIKELLDPARLLIDEAVEMQEPILREALDDPYVIEGMFDLSQVDLEALASGLKTGNAHLKAEQLRGILSQKLQRMIKVNKSRVDYQDKLQNIIDDYNERSASDATYPEELVAFTQELQEEERRAGREQLSEEELAIFDLLTRPALQLSEGDRETVKAVARELLKDLKHEKLGLDWQKKQRERGRVQEAIEIILDSLPDVYTKEVYSKKCEDVYIHIQDYYREGGDIYAA